VADGDEIEVDGEGGLITLGGGEQTLRVAPIPPFMQELINDGGLMQHIRKKRRDF
jgi:3-isopropylmalate/(R)-2-methylmalate dehydratase small subunit